MKRTLVKCTGGWRLTSVCAWIAITIVKIYSISTTPESFRRPLQSGALPSPGWSGSAPRQPCWLCLIGVMLCVFWGLTSFSQRPWESPLLLCACVDVPQFLYPIACWWTFDLFAFLGVVINKAAMDIYVLFTVFQYYPITPWIKILFSVGM